MKKTKETQQVIDTLEVMPKHGTAYDEKGRHGWRNPIRSDTGGLLRSLVIATGALRILEIGTAHGLSGCYLASALSSLGEMHTIEWDEATAKEAQENFNKAGLPVKVYSGDALKIISELEGTFDFVFLDANKDGYLEQLNLLKKKGLLTNDVTIVADNVIDRATEMADFLSFMESSSEIINTECGLLVGKMPK